MLGRQWLKKLDCYSSTVDSLVTGIQWCCQLRQFFIDFCHRCRHPLCSYLHLITCRLQTEVQIITANSQNTEITFLQSVKMKVMKLTCAHTHHFNGHCLQVNLISQLALDFPKKAASVHSSGQIFFWHQPPENTLPHLFCIDSCKWKGHHSLLRQLSDTNTPMKLTDTYLTNI